MTTTLAMETHPTMAGHITRHGAARRALIALTAVLVAHGAAQAQQQQLPQANICEAIDPAVTKTGIANWTKANERQQGTYSLLQIVPSGQTNKDWTDMLTIQTFDRRQINVHDYIDKFTNTLKSACANLEVANKEEKPDQVSVMLLCRDPDRAKAPQGVSLKSHEVFLLKGMRGLVSAYLIERSWHSDGAAKNSVFASPETRKTWQAWADSVSLCSKPCAPNVPNPCLPPPPGQRAPATPPKK
jgi:hypothetical protein